MEQSTTERLVAAGVALTVDALTAKVVSAFSRAGVEPILLKGASIIGWLYGEHPERYSVDVDLLVAPDQIQHGEQALRALGFVPFEPARPERHALTWVRAESGPSVDLHRTLYGVGVSDEAAWDVLSRGTEWLEIAGLRVEALSATARALHVALHAAQQGVEMEQSMTDVMQATQKLPLDLWRDAAALAERLGAVPTFAAGLRLVEPGRDIADQLALPNWKPAELSLREQTARDLTLTLNRLVDTPGLRPRAALALRRAFPPPESMRSRSDLARRGPAGLAAAYVGRMGWLACRLLPALQAVVRARRVSQRATTGRM